jgi:hypothetical protein
MTGLFPIGAGISEMRAVIDIIKRAGGSMQISSLSKATKKNIDMLLPLVWAGRELGFINVADGYVRVTPAGKALNLGNLNTYIKRGIEKEEPFKTAVAILKEQGSRSTHQLSMALRHKGIVLYSQEKGNEEALRQILQKWAVRCNLLKYGTSRDTWSLTD